MSRNDNPWSEAIQILAQTLGQEKLRADALVDELRIAQTQRDEAWAQRDDALRAMDQDTDKDAEIARLRSACKVAQEEANLLRREMANVVARANDLSRENERLLAERKAAIEDFLHDVVRFEVIDHRTGKDGRVFTTAAEGAAQISLDFQDDHHTLKVVVSDRVLTKTWQQPAQGWLKTIRDE
jgi:hypothetical protein